MPTKTPPTGKTTQNGIETRNGNCSSTKRKCNNIFHRFAAEGYSSHNEPELCGDIGMIIEGVLIGVFGVWLISCKFCLFLVRRRVQDLPCVIDPLNHYHKL